MTTAGLEPRPARLQLVWCGSLLSQSLPLEYGIIFHNFCLRGGELYIQLNLHESLHNGHVSITAIFWWTVHTFTLVSTSLQWPLSSVPKVAVVEGFNCSTLSSYQEPCKVLDRHQCSFNILLSLTSFVFIVILMI